MEETCSRVAVLQRHNRQIDNVQWELKHCDWYFDICVPLHKAAGSRSSTRMGLASNVRLATNRAGNLGLGSTCIPPALLILR